MNTRVVKSYPKILQRTHRLRTKDLEQELVSLRSLVIGLIGKDEEGSYRPEFVEQTLKAAQDPILYTFSPKDFAKRLRSV